MKYIAVIIIALFFCSPAAADTAGCDLKGCMLHMNVTGGYPLEVTGYSIDRTQYGASINAGNVMLMPVDPSKTDREIYDEINDSENHRICPCWEEFKTMCKISDLVIP